MLLQDGISLLNLVSYLTACFFSITLFVYLNSAQAFLLPFILESNGEIGQVSGQLTFYDELLSLGVVFLAGVVSDRVGRHVVYSAGFVIMGMALVIYPFARNVYPDLLLARLLFSMGGGCAAAMLTAVLADFAQESWRGKLAAGVGTMSGLGALLALFVLLRIPADLSQHYGISKLEATQRVFVGVGVGAMVYGAALFFGLRVRRVGEESPSTIASLLRASSRATSHRSPSPTFLQLAAAGLSAARDMPIAVVSAKVAVTSCSTYDSSLGIRRQFCGQ
jgi:MFS family permease